MYYNRYSLKNFKLFTHKSNDFANAKPYCHTSKALFFLLLTMRILVLMILLNNSLIIKTGYKLSAFELFLVYGNMITQQLQSSTQIASNTVLYWNTYIFCLLFNSLFNPHAPGYLCQGFAFRHSLGSPFRSNINAFLIHLSHN